MGYVGGDGDGDGTGAMLHFFILDLFMNDVSQSKMVRYCNRGSVGGMNIQRLKCLNRPLCVIV